MRVSVRRTPEPLEAAARRRPRSRRPPAASPPEPGRPQTDGVVRVEAPMVGVFYRAPQPGAPPFVEEGDAVAAGPDALHPRGDEADERDQGRRRRRRPRDPRRERASPSSSASSSSSSSRSRCRRSTRSDDVQPRARREPRRGRRPRHPRAARARTSRRSPSTRPPTRTRSTSRLADRAVCIGPPPATRELPPHPVARRRRDDDRLRGRPSRLGLPRREPGVRARRAPTTTSSSSARAPTSMARMGDKVQAKAEMRARRRAARAGHRGRDDARRGARPRPRSSATRSC